MQGFAARGFTAMSPAARHARSGSGDVRPDPRLDALLRRALWLGAAVVLLVPAARGSSAWFGFMPLWLLGMPLTALWALHRFRVPPLFVRAATSLRASRRRRTGQARRRSQRPGQRGARRAA